MYMTWSEVLLTFSAGGQLAGFHRRAKTFEYNFFTRTTYSRWSNQAGTMIVEASQFACCPARNETPAWLNLVYEALQQKSLLLFFFVIPTLKYFKSFKPIIFFSQDD